MAEAQTKKKKSIKSLPDIWHLEEYGQLSNVLVIGCGGTGGHLIPNLARAISVVNKLANGDRERLNLIIADGDIVEHKNLVRQHFINRDLAKNKAEVLAERYSAAFGMEIGAISKDIENEDVIKDSFKKVVDHITDDSKKQKFKNIVKNIVNTGKEEATEAFEKTKAKSTQRSD